MYKRILIFFLILFGNLSANEHEIKQYEIKQPVTVIANRVPTAFPYIGRAIATLDKNDIKSAPAKSISELLEYISGVDIKQQGVDGIQADVSIRGAGYEQTLVLLDGIKIIDPQTGHHNLNLPVSLESIEKIEILKGQGARLYGPNAYGGVINIITSKTPAKSISLSSSLGSYNTSRHSFQLLQNIGKTNHHVSVVRAASDGYRPNTDYDFSNVSYLAGLKTGTSELELTAGYTDKKFGANSFYSSTSTRQWEHTKTFYSSLGLTFHKNKKTLKMNLAFRRHKDHYIWNREHPEWYENFHTTHLYSFDMNYSWSSIFGTTSLGQEISADEITSTNLGDHSRTRYGFFFEHLYHARPDLHISTGASIFHNTHWGWQGWPGLDVSYYVNPSNKFYFTVGKAFRIPTYTELYYSDPGHQSNPNLKAEQGWNYEWGYSLQRHSYLVNAACFIRKGSDIIDWLWMEQEQKWLAENIINLNTKGFETDFQKKLPNLSRLDRISFGYTYLTTNKESMDSISSYTISHFKHQFTAGIKLNYWNNKLTQTIHYRYQDRISFQDQMLTDTRIMLQTLKFDFSLDINNVFDKLYYEYRLFPAPGRRFQCQVTWKI